jgi:hypothetical protein
MNTAYDGARGLRNEPARQDFQKHYQQFSFHKPYGYQQHRVGESLELYIAGAVRTVVKVKTKRTSYFCAPL